MDTTNTLDMQTEQHLPDVDMLEEDESCQRVLQTIHAAADRKALWFGHIRALSKRSSAD
ncbi:hypothetical protein BX070DRAFT_230265, partial [Coemansia spiralis]